MELYTTKKVEVSVILLAVNRYEFLDKSINSILNQSIKEWELLIVQDGNNTKVTEKINSYVNKDKRIYFFNRKELNSIGSSINYAIQRSNGSFIAILDDDDIWVDPLKLEKQLSQFKENQNLVLISSWAFGIDKFGKKISEIKKSNDINFIKKTCLLTNPIIHSSSLFRKEIAIEIGMYDETISDYQDWDFNLKILKKGEIKVLPDFMVEYRMWEGNATSNKISSMVKSTYKILKRHKNNFPNSNFAFFYYYLFLVYSKLPFKIQNFTTKYISRFKKNYVNRYSRNI